MAHGEENEFGLVVRFDEEMVDELESKGIKRRIRVAWINESWYFMMASATVTKNGAQSQVQITSQKDMALILLDFYEHPTACELGKHKYFMRGLIVDAWQVVGRI